MGIRRHQGGQLVAAPDALAEVARGIDVLGDVLARTLGPMQGAVVNAREDGSPEFLTDSETIVRRVVELPERGPNVGAMMLRNLVWRMHERYGDGGATAATLARAMVRGASKRIAAGANPMRLRRGMERGVAACLPALIAQASPVDGQETLTHLATSITGDSELGELLGELFDILGPDGAVLIEEYTAPYLEREYLAGSRWRARPAARAMLPDNGDELTLAGPLVLVIDETLSRASQVSTALEQAAQAPGKPPLLLVAPDVTGEALTMLSMNRAQGTLALGAAVLTGATSGRADDLADIAAITGGDVVADMLGRSPQRVQPAYFGRARHVTLSRERLTIVDGNGDRQVIQRRVDEVRGRLRHSDVAQDERERLRLRLGRLSGGIGILKIGADTEREREARKSRAQRAIRVLGPAMEDGLVPGGGVAYVGCGQAVEGFGRCCVDRDEREGLSVLADALTAPLKQIVHNRGLTPPAVALSELERRGPGYGYDARRGKYASMAAIGVLDSLRVTRGALEMAVSAAGMAVTIDAIVLPHEQRRELSIQP